MRSIVRGVVALFAAFLMMDVANAAPTIVSPADYATVKTLTGTMKNLISPLNSDVSIFSKANTTARENYEAEYFYNNSLPVGLSWSGTTGNCTVKVWRTNGGSESAPFFSETVSGTSTECYNLEVGCNYTWKVTDSQGNSAIGHFFTEDQAPRIIRGRRSNFTYSSGADCSNGRDIGGWATTNGKRVKQGKIYRSGQLEYCSFKEGSGIYQKMDMLYDVLGIRVDVDLRTVENVNAFADWKAEWDTGSDNVCKWSGIGPDVERFTIEWETLGKGPSTGNPFEYDGKYGCQFPSYSALYSDSTISKKSGNEVLYSYTQTAAQNKIAVWAAFNRIYQAVVVDKEPVLFHCSHGKDRTGSLAAVIHGLLGVSEANIKRDFATAWFCNPDYTFTQTSMNTMLTGLKNLDTASTKTLAGGCEKYLISCATSAGDTAGATKVAAFKAAMLEDVETPEGNVVIPEPEEDTFVYTHYYWRSPSDGGSISSQYNTGPWFTSLNDNSLMTPETQPILYSGTKWDSVRGSYSHCYNFITTSTKKYARTSNAGNPIMVGKLVFDAANGGGIKAGATNFKPFFTSEGHTVSDRTIIEHRGGLVEFDNVDIYLTQWGKDKYTSGRVSAYDGTASVDIWANATMRVKDFISVSPEKTYLKFLSGNSNNARLESLEHGDESYPYNSFGWFTGGAAGTKQYIKVQGAYPLKFSASGKTSGVVGALGLEFEFGANNGTGTAAMLQVAGALNINAGSTITVDAGGNGAGTYKLVSAGTLNDYANLDLRSNYTVTNCKDGYYGTIVKSGSNINLTIQEGTPPIEDEDEGLIDTEKEGDWGYRKTIGNEIVLAFTNHTKSVNWRVPSKLENVRFLVVGGGGGGGADTHASNTHGGAGGGGGGVVTGLVNFAENSVITVSVGAGGNGGVTATQGGSNSKYGAAYSGNASYVIVDGSEYFWTAGGGGDNGAETSTNTTLTKGNVGNDGGSSAGSRPGQTGRGAVVASRVASVSNVKYADTSFGHQGGAGYSGTETFYNYYSAAGGGGGATAEGETATAAKAAGKGGEGLTSDITGTSRVYGSGGGGGAVAGGCGALGGTGAGCGNMADVTADNYATYLNAAANQGGGGGGGGRNIPGGKGGSGIVVLRYVDPDYSDPYVVAVPTAISGLTFTGSELTGVVSATGYTLSGNTATDAGEYIATASLAEGYKWSDDTTADKSITWSIAKATNEWTTEPKIEPATWTEGSAGTYTAGVAKSGTEVVVTITKDGASSNASLDNLNSWTAGSYSITFTVDESKNYSLLSKEVTVTVNVSENEEPGDDPVSQIPIIPAEWGYVKTGLGDLKNEVAVVFTNHVDKAMSWTVPDTIENVQFLVVGGGGGGGGAVNSTKGGAGGAGGGGGCVVTGIVNKLEENTVITVGVGGGGNGGLYDTSNGSAYHGTNSYFKVGDVTYVTAYGGAGDLGYNKDSGVNNGSNSGSRYNGTAASAAVGTAATWDQTALSDKLSNVATLRHKGGNNAKNKTYSSGGGGGATEDGKAPGSSSYGGDGGKGLTSSITGVEKMYGSGGSGATAKNGGYDRTAPEGAGSSYAKQNATNHGGDGADNQGGGGGGGGYQGNGGKGGSGIVVFRYTLKSEVKVDAVEYIESKLTDKVYTGSLLKSGLTEDEAYTVSEEGGINVGEYIVSVTLKSGFVWADGNTSSTSNFTWEITKHENKWATEPLLSVTSWAQGYAPNVKFVAPVQTIGELNATITTNGVTEAFSGTLPTEPGDYTINYSVTETDNYNGRTWSASFKIYRSEPINGGYRVFGLGDDGNEEAMVFTRSGNWNIDKSLKNVQFLVVGGGGGGGADASATEGNPLQGGAGGGGGGVVTGLVNFVNGQTVAITVGTGGLGGIAGDNTSGKYGAAQSQATDSSFGIGNVTYVTAVAGGGDSGSTSKSYNADLAGSNGGSGSGGRPNMAGGNADTENLNLTYIVCGDKLGNNGGSGCTTAWDGYGYAAAGGGGGAVHAGQPGYVDSTTGNYNGGNGGEGYLSDITGTELVYGSGGGGGTVKGGSVGGKGGTGAGDGVVGGNATSAIANQGGGGGGGGRAGNGGNGGSGIVVFRYVVNTTPTVTVGGVEVKVDANGVITNITTACDNFVVVGDLSNYKFADYYTASVGDDGKLKIALNPEVATPVINETANGADDAIVVTDAKVALGITNAKVGLFYSVEAYSAPTCVGAPIDATTPIPATGKTLSLQIDKPKVDAAFFKIVVTDIPSAE